MSRFSSPFLVFIFFAETVLRHSFARQSDAWKLPSDVGLADLRF